MMLQPDTLIHERYRIIRLLGQGGFGAVYEALDERLNRRVALKQLVRVSDRISRQFTNEAQLLANLQHPALPRVTDHFADPSGPCLVMDFIPGDDLATLLFERNSPFPLAQVLRWGDQLLDVLHYLHTLQPPIIHRDLKPQNLKLRPDGSLILLDFGLAKGHAGDLQPSSFASSMLAFTRGFAPPEQVEGTGTDARSDLYALGATLYCLLTNTPPPEAQTRVLTVMRGRGDALRPAHTLNPAIPESVSNVLQHAMALEMDDRPPDAQTLGALLDQAHAGSPASAVGAALIAGATEIDASVVPAAPDELATLYEQATAYMVTRQWREAHERLDLLERRAPGYRDVRTRLEHVRQEQPRTSDRQLAPTTSANTEETHGTIDQQRAPTTSAGVEEAAVGRRRSAPWLWLVGIGAVALLGMAAMLAVRAQSRAVVTTSATAPAPTSTPDMLEQLNSAALPVATATATAAPPTSTVSPTLTPTLIQPSVTPVLPTKLPAAVAVRPAAVKASGYIPEGKDACGTPNTYEPSKAVDGARDTAWRVQGDGRGAWIELTYSTPIMVAEVGIVAGFDKVDPCDSTDRFFQGRIVRKVRLEFDNGQQVEVTLDRVRAPQYVTLDNIQTQRIRLVVLESDAPPANNGRDLMALSEIDVLARIMQ